MGFWDSLGKGFKSSDDATKSASKYVGDVAKEAVKPENVAKIAVSLSKDYSVDHLGIPHQDVSSDSIHT